MFSRPSSARASSAEYAPPESRYISHLLAAASRRDTEQELQREKKLARDARHELIADGMADTERFVTAGYKRKLEDDAAARAALASLNDDDDHRKTDGRDVRALYRNMMKSDDERKTEERLTEMEKMKMKRKKRMEEEEREGHQSMKAQESREGSMRLVVDVKQREKHEEEEKHDVQTEMKKEEDVNATEDKAASARERFLARKRQRAAQGTQS